MIRRMRPPKIIPEWFLQVMLSGAGIGLTGGIWYFMSVQKYHTALWWGFTSIIVFLLAAALYIRNDLLRSEQQTAANLSTAVTPSVPQRPEESKVDLQGETPAEKETLIETYPPVSTAQNMTKEQV